MAATTKKTSIHEALANIQAKLGVRANLTPIPSLPGVYKITNPIGQVYIGSAKNLKRRYGQYSGDSFKGQRRLFNSFLQYGKEKHVFEVIEYCTEKELHNRERFWSEKYDAIDNLNCIVTVDDTDKAITSDETRTLQGNAQRGKVISEHQRQLISLRFKGKKQTQEHINKRKMFGEANPMYGKVGYWKGKRRSAESVRKTRSKLLGRRNPQSAKKVVNIDTGEVYPSAKELSEKIGMNYSTLRAKLNGYLTNNTNYKYGSYNN